MLCGILQFFFTGACLLLLFASCSTLPRVSEKSVTSGLPAPAAGPLVAASENLAGGREAGDSSLMLLADAGDALDWRLALIDSARSSIDIQLYLWSGGVSGPLVLERALLAADRGVRVRVLVDNFMSTNDVGLAVLSRHSPNFEVRLFNPSHIRGSLLGNITSTAANFKELNRRMHNKTFTADRCLTIVGGRNIGDHYFGLDEKYNFLDLDVLAAGPVVAEVSDGFDKFWNASDAYPASMLTKKGGPDLLAKRRVGMRALLEEERSGKLSEFSIEPKNWDRELTGLKAKMVTGRARFLQDHPEPGKDKRQVVRSLRDMTMEQKGSLRFVSPYLIPSERGIFRIDEVMDSGTEVSILVPSLSASDHALVDGHYNKYRKPLLDTGSVLHEFRGDPSEEVRSLADSSPVRSERITLHLKTIVGDNRRCFIGSLNLDPRALKINTESGILIDSPELSAELGRLIEKLSNDENSWRVSYDENGQVQWQSRGEIRQRKPPAKWTRRVGAWFGGLLPIKSQI